MAESSRRNSLYWELFMKRRILVSAVVSVASIFASEAVYAAPAAAVSMPVHALFGKTKLVNFNVRNDSATPLKLRCGDTLLTVEAGKTMDLHLPVGARVIAEEATNTHPAGSVITEVSSQISGATIAVK